MDLQQRIVTFAGNVQGVGFRYTACIAARGYNVAGYVKNLPDGGVECLAEGDSNEIDAFLTELCGRMQSHIRSKNEVTAPWSGHYESFGVRY